VEYIRGFTRDVVIAIMANIEGKELRCQNNKIGHPEHQHTEVTVPQGICTCDFESFLKANIASKMCETMQILSITYNLIHVKLENSPVSLISDPLWGILA